MSERLVDQKTAKGLARWRKGRAQFRATGEEVIVEEGAQEVIDFLDELDGAAIIKINVSDEKTTIQEG